MGKRRGSAGDGEEVVVGKKGSTMGRRADRGEEDGGRFAREDELAGSWSSLEMEMQ